MSGLSIWIVVALLARVVILKSAPYSTAVLGLKKRPIYNIAHMVNSKSEIGTGWVNSANAIESDLSFNSNGTAQRFYHGLPCDFQIIGHDCSDEDDPMTHFSTIKHKAQTRGLTLFWMDLLKLTGSGITDFRSSGQKLAELMTKSGSLFPPGTQVPLYVLLEVGKLSQKNFFRGFREYISKRRPDLLQKFGYNFSDLNADIDETLTTFEGLGIRENIWIGDCLTNFAPDYNTRIERLDKILTKRDSYTSSSSGLAPFKVYVWTIDKVSNMRYYLQLGVDAIIVNYPDRLRTVVKEEFHDSLYLATQATDPWERIKASEALPPLAQGCGSGSTCWKYTTPGDYCRTSTRCNIASDCWGNLCCI